MNATIAICTRNRAKSLEQTMVSLTKMRVPPGWAWEVIVINNGSSDETSAIIARFENQLPVREVLEPVAGLSSARNRAVDEAKGEYIIWTDDDVLVDEDWLSAYREAFQRHPDAAVFGGKILPRLEAPVPKWFASSLNLLGHPICLRDFGNEILPLSKAEDRLPFGANYCVRLIEQRQNRYDPNLGVAPHQNRVGEETEVICAILAAGNAGYWVPDSIAYHVFSRERQSLDRIFKYFKAHGETCAFLERERRQPLFAGVPRWLWRRMAERSLRYHFDRLFASPQRWVKSLSEYAFDRGAFDFWLSQARQNKSHRRDDGAAPPRTL